MLKVEEEAVACENSIEKRGRHTLAYYFYYLPLHRSPARRHYFFVPRRDARRAVNIARSPLSWTGGVTIVAALCSECISSERHSC